MPKTVLKDIVSRNIRTFRIEVGLTQQQIADRAGFKVSYVARLENNSQNMSLDVLERIADALKRPVVDLVSGENQVAASKKHLDTFSEAMRLLQVFESSLSKITT